MTWDFQGRNWQVGRREEEFTAGGWASWELAGRETGRGIYRGRLGIVGTGRQGDRKRNLTAGDGTFKGDEFTT